MRSIMHAGDAVQAAAWLYYAAGRTQSEVAEQLGVSRQTVANYLAEARECGYVTIHVAPDILERNQLAGELCEKYSLTAVYVVPALQNETEQRAAVGRAGGEALHALMRGGDVIGVSSGRTVSALARFLSKSSRTGVTVIQVSGSSIAAAGNSPEVCASAIAAKLNARCLNLHAPAYVSTKELADQLKNEPALVWHFEKMAAADIIVFGIGELSVLTNFEHSPYVDAAMRDRYIAAGAAGVAFDRFFGPAGEEIEGPIAARTMAVELGTVRSIPVRLAVCSGVQKYDAVSAGLRSGMVTHLVLDAALARALCRGGTGQ